jgi:hypothetical protein
MRLSVYRRHELITGLDTKGGNLAWDAMGNAQVVTALRLNTDVHARRGAVRHSDEESEMALERRDGVIQSVTSDQSEFLGGIR